MRAGKLRRRITFQQRSGADDGQGGLAGEERGASGWANVCTVWADIEELGGREQLEQERLQSIGDVKFTIRWRPGIFPAMRALYGTRIFNVRTVSDVDSRHRELTVTAQELGRG